MKRTVTLAIASAGAAALLASAPGTGHAETLGDIGQAVHCGFLEGAGSSFLDPNCRGKSYDNGTFEVGPYGSRQACERAGRQLLAEGRAASYRCYLGHTTYMLHAKRR